MTIKSYKDVVQAVAIAGLSALATGLIGLWVKRLEKQLEANDTKQPNKKKKAK